MLNNVVLVGRLVEVPTYEKGKDITITLAVSRIFKNSDGEYETDFIPIKLFDSVAQKTSEWCEKGDVIGAKGRIECLDGKVEVIAEKISFLSSRKED